MPKVCLWSLHLEQLIVEILLPLIMVSSGKLTLDHVAVTTGGSSLALCFPAICDPGDEILVPHHLYELQWICDSRLGLPFRPIPTSIKKFCPPTDKRLDTIKSEKTKAFVFSNPGNPTGAIYSQDEVDRIANWCERNGIFLISDEVYRKIGLKQSWELHCEVQTKTLVVVIDSLSKTWSACGLRLSAHIPK